MITYAKGCYPLLQSCADYFARAISSVGKLIGADSALMRGATQTIELALQ